MNDIPESPDDNELNGPGELSEDDLAVLRAFEAAEELLVKDPPADVSAPGSSLFEQSYATQSPQSSPGEIPEEMLVLFVTEADEDITAMRETLHHLEQDDPADSASLTALQRTAHKLKGTAGSIGYERISTIAQYVEKFVAAVKNGTINKRYPPRGTRGDVYFAQHRYTYWRSSREDVCARNKTFRAAES